MADLLHPDDREDESQETPFDPGDFVMAMSAEDQMAAEFSIFGVFSLNSLSGFGNDVRCFGFPRVIPDRNRSGAYLTMLITGAGIFFIETIVRMPQFANYGVQALPMT